MRVMGVIPNGLGFQITLMTLMTLFPSSVKFFESLFIDDNHAPYLAIDCAPGVFEPHTRFHAPFRFPNEFTH